MRGNDEPLTLNPKFPVNEIFETIQGEASYTGTPSIFIRLQGCPVGCPWCDTKHTWTVEQKHEVSPALMMTKGADDSPIWSYMTADQIVEAISGFRAKHVVLTGGEPAMYTLYQLTGSLLDAGYSVQLETSGTFQIIASTRTFITVSPKFNMPGGKTVRRDCLLMANEIKLPVGKASDLAPLLDALADIPKQHLVYLQPLSQSLKATEVCMEMALKHGFRVSIQTHKYLGVR